MEELFSPERLRLARQRRGLFVQELAARVKVTVTAVSRWECGNARPKNEHIDALARALEFPRAFFFGDAPPVMDGAVFRSLVRTTARQRDRARSAAAQAIALDQWIEQHFERPTPNVPDLCAQRSPSDAAVTLRAVWGLGYRPIPNLVHLLEANGVRVYSLVHEGPEIDALSGWHGSTPFVFLNTTKTAERSRMDAAHELGHLVLHAHSDEDRRKAHEDEARTFAAALLMPEQPFIASAPRRIGLGTIIDAKQQWGVSALAYVYRLYTLGRIGRWLYQSLCIEIKSSFPNDEPGPPRPRETSQVLAKVLVPPRAGGSVTRRDAAEHLRIPLRDLDEITCGLALTALSGGDASPPTRRTASGGIQRLK